MTLPLFVYGSMRDEEVRTLVLGRMPGVAAALVPGESYPYLVSLEGARAAGELIYGLDERCLDRILFFEGDEYAFVECEVERAGGDRVAAMHFGGVAIPESPVVTWSFEQWQMSQKARFVSMTRRYMALWGRATRAQAEVAWQDLLREYPENGRER